MGTHTAHHGLTFSQKNKHISARADAGILHCDQRSQRRLMPCAR